MFKLSKITLTLTFLISNIAIAGYELEMQAMDESVLQSTEEQVEDPTSRPLYNLAVQVCSNMLEHEHIIRQICTDEALKQKRLRDRNDPTQLGSAGKLWVKGCMRRPEKIIPGCAEKVEEALIGIGHEIDHLIDVSGEIIDIVNEIDHMVNVSGEVIEETIDIIERLFPEEGPEEVMTPIEPIVEDPEPAPAPAEETAPNAVDYYNEYSYILYE